VAVGVVLVVVHLLVLHQGLADPLKDDTYISLRFARNLVEGHGLVFNPGERVEGFTNPIWTLLGAVPLALGLDPFLFLKAAGAAALVGLVLSLGVAVRDLSPVGRCAPALVAASAAVAYWSQSGMETVAFAWAALEGTRRLGDAVRRRSDPGISAGLVWACAALLRPEGVAWFGLAWLVSGLQARRPGPWAVSALAFAAPVGLWQAFRVVYYGAWLPNTFYAKVGGEADVLERGLDYLALGAVETPVALLALGALVFVRRALADPRGRIACAILAFHGAYLLAVGGDYMPLGRFLVPAVPLAALALAAGATSSLPAGALALGAALLGLQPYLSGRALDPDWARLRFEAFGLWVGTHLPPDAVVCLGQIGAVGYLGQRPVLDTHGLVDAHIARHRPEDYEVAGGAGHTRGDADYVLERAPDAVMMANVWYARVPMTPEALTEHQDMLGVTDRLLLGQPAFFEAYEALNYRTADDFWVGLWVRFDSPLHPDHPEFRGPVPALRL